VQNLDSAGWSPPDVLDRQRVGRDVDGAARRDATRDEREQVVREAHRVVVSTRRRARRPPRRGSCPDPAPRRRQPGSRRAGDSHAEPDPGHRVEEKKRQACGPRTPARQPIPAIATIEPSANTQPRPRRSESQPPNRQRLACLRNQLRCTGYRERPATKRSARLSDQGKTRSAGD